MEPFVGQIIPVGFNFAPPGWFLCNGQLVSIAEYSVLFNLIGTAYGGDGVQTFGIPDLRGRVPLHDGQGSGLSNYGIGQSAGTEFVTLVASQVGAHSHSLMSSTSAANSITPGPTTALGVASAGAGISVYSPGSSETTTLAPGSITRAGNSTPHENRQPYLAVNFIIAWAGIYPSQN